MLPGASSPGRCVWFGGCRPASVGGLCVLGWVDWLQEAPVSPIQCAVVCLDEVRASSWDVLFDGSASVPQLGGCVVDEDRLSDVKDRQISFCSCRCLRLLLMVFASFLYDLRVLSGITKIGQECPWRKFVHEREW